jgi:putative glutamine amidotransferase
MKKRVYISQRVDIHPDYKEKRDALDQRWADFVWEAGYLAQPVANCCKMLEELLRFHPPDAIILSGGNSPVLYGGNAQERDEADTLLLHHAEKNNTPLIGVCRGMQSIVLHFGGLLQKVDGHVAVRHMITGDISREVNSYHSFAVKQLPESLKASGIAEDGNIEYIEHIRLPIRGIMWHPEREEKFNKDDLAFFKELFR